MAKGNIKFNNVEAEIEASDETVKEIACKALDVIASTSALYFIAKSFSNIMSNSNVNYNISSSNRNIKEIEQRNASYNRRENNRNNEGYF